MRYLSIFSGIEAATVAWKPLGWKAVAFAEIDSFPSSVLKFHYPEIRNLGDVTKYEEWPEYPVDIVVGGSPCQGFSIAGKREGLDDARSKLALSFTGVVEKYKPRWILWENVPGVLSCNKGLDFACFLNSLVELRYSIAYRVIDAQFTGVAQRRRRVFVVGYLDTTFNEYGCDKAAELASKVLFEPEMLSRNNKESEREGKETSRTFDDCSAISFQERAGKEGGEKGILIQKEKMATLTTFQNQSVLYKTHPQDSRIEECTNEIADTVTSRYGTCGGNMPIVMATGQCNAEITENRCCTLSCNHEAPIVNDENTVLRRLTPIECERLQGFPDDYTKIPWNGKDKDCCPDNLRYKALGNSMATTVMGWIGKRIQKVSDEIEESFQT